MLHEGTDIFLEQQKRHFSLGLKCLIVLLNNINNDTTQRYKLVLKVPYDAKETSL